MAVRGASRPGMKGMTGVQRAARGDTWLRLTRLRRQRRVQTWRDLRPCAPGPGAGAGHLPCAWARSTRAQARPRCGSILLADLVYVLVVAALVLARVARMVADRRARSAGSRLHLRLTGVFALIALVPTVLVAVFAVLTVNVGLEGWFSDRVRSVVGSSLAAAEAYRGRTRSDLIDGYRGAGRLSEPRPAGQRLHRRR